MPRYIELRSPSPEPLPLPSVPSVDAESSLEASRQRPEEELGLQSCHTTCDTQSHDLNLEDKEHDIEKAGNAFLGELRVSDIFDVFREPNWRQRTPSFATMYTHSLGSVSAIRDDTLQTFVNRLNQGRSIFGRGHLSHLQTICELISGDHAPTSHFLETVVRKLGARTSEILEWLAPKMHLPEYGARALGAAAHCNNIQCVDALLRRGVHINAKISRPHSTSDCRCQISIIDYAQLQYFSQDQTRVSHEMIMHLLDRGSEEPTGYKMCLLSLLVCVLRQRIKGPEALFLSKLRSSVQQIHGFAKAMCITESVLEACIIETQFHNYFRIDGYSRLEEFLLGSEKFSSSPLAALIYKDGRWLLVERLLAKTETINDYCKSLPIRINDHFTGYAMKSQRYDTIWSINPLQAAASHGREHILHALLQNGADVNCPARGLYGVTSLQAICWWKTYFLEGLERKLRIVNILLDRGADVNAAPAWQCGLSALQAAASVGDVEVADLLVSRGADVNAPACKYGGGTALAIAAKQRHTHMVQFLLKAGAAIRTPGPPATFSGTTYEDRNADLSFIRSCAVGLAAKEGSNEGPPRDYQEYEAEWTDDPTYDKED